MSGKLSESQIENLAVEIREFLLQHNIWIDTEIYFNGKRFTTRNPETKEYHYNDRENLFVEENQNPRDYFEYVAEDHILSMSFEGPVYSMINCYGYYGLTQKFDEIFKKYGVYYEQGNAWNLTCYYR
jgi:hypothetical protein